jgi:ferritin-like metal-binding protein YciE
MDTGRDFLKAQLNNAIAQHQTLVEALRDHAEQADDPRYRQLCQQFLPQTERHQGMLEEYGKSMGADSGGGIKGALGSVIGKARDAVDALRETDFLRVVGDIVMIRQAQDTFGTFARAGERLGEQRLAELGRMGEQEHDQMQRQFNQYCAELFVDHVQNTVPEKDASRTGRTRNTTSNI